MIYEYECPSGHVEVKRGGVDDSTSPCHCAQIGRRKEFNLAAIVGATVMKEQKYRVSEFLEAGMEVDYHYTKAENEGMPVKRPNLYKKAKAKAKAMGAPIS